MANGDLLRQLFRGYAKRDDATFRRAAEAIIDEERAKNHRLLAEDLEKLLANSNYGVSDRRLSGNQYEVPKDRERGFPLLEIRESSSDWRHLVLPKRTTEMLARIVDENSRRDLLAAGGLRPIQRLLFYGPPGCGKTLSAKVIACVLSYPLIIVRFDAVVSSYLGETAANLRRVFDFIQRGQWIVLFDEFDSISKDRDNPSEHGELKRAVNTLLNLMDTFHGESMLIAATNHEGLLDKAFWRRFEAVISFSPPSFGERILLFHLFLRGFEHSQVDFGHIARQLKGATGSDIESISVEAARQALLASRNTILEFDISSAIELYRDRLGAMSINKRRKTSSPIRPQHSS